MDFLFWLVSPLPQEPGKGIGLACVQIVSAIQSQVFDIAALLYQLASEGMEFVIPVAGDPLHRQPGIPKPGGEIRLSPQGRGPQHGGHGLAVVAKAACGLAGAGIVVQVGEDALAVPVGKHPDQGLALETPGPGFIVSDAGRTFTSRQPGVAVLQQQGLQPRRGVAGVMKREPPPSEYPTSR